MLQLLFLYDILHSPFPNLTSGLVGVLLGAAIGKLIINESLRWVVGFSLLGIFSTYAFLQLNAGNHFYLYPEVRFFAPFYAFIGLFFGVIYRKLTNDTHWSRLAFFGLLGVISAIIYQTKGPFSWHLLLVLLGAVIGVIIWYFVIPRVRYAIFLGVAGAVLAWTLFVASYSFQFSFLFLVLGGALGTFVGWHIIDRNMRWAVAFTMLGAMSGSIMEATYWWFGINALVIGSIIGGVVGLVISQFKQRSAVAFAIFGGLFSVFILSAIEMIEIFRWLEQSLL